MPFPFPGMDPYLEYSAVRTGFHHKLATEINAELTTLLPPQYYADTESQIAYEPAENGSLRIMRPDISVERAEIFASGQVNEPAEQAPAATAIPAAPTKITLQVDVPSKLFSVVLKTVDGNQLVTNIELLSPINKLSRADGFDSYQRKRRAILRSDAHLLEIDLTRRGDRSLIEEALPPASYLILLSRSYDRPLAEVWPLRIQDTLPIIPIPLLRPDADVALDLQAIFVRVYERYGYQRRIEYRQDPPRPLFSKEEQAWIGEQLVEVR
ncbi:DUF4058 family protein [Chloroflexi bacterium TSY]|nr:DUF4058 family protein [Chloroflexi bacterium TSY]